MLAAPAKSAGGLAQAFHWSRSISAIDRAMRISSFGAGIDGFQTAPNLTPFAPAAMASRRRASTGHLFGHVRRIEMTQLEAPAVLRADIFVVEEAE